MDRVVTLVAAVALTLGCVGAVFGLRRMWRNETRVYDHRPSWFLYSDVAWRGAVRAMPSGLLGGIFGVIGIWFVVAYPDRAAQRAMPNAASFGRPNRNVAKGVVVGAFVALLVSGGLMLRLIAPHLRAQPGAITEWRRGRRRRRAA
jgi:hypothetical protein